MAQTSLPHQSLYRKWRPQTFADVTGQEHVVRTLANALSQGRIAHAYLFSGPRGTGKTTVARLLAKSLNCAQGPTAEACNQCEACRRIAQGTSLDTMEIDGASNRGIDEIREIRDNIRFAPAEGRYRVYIIDEVHMLTAEAFNALLKVLEEPPAHGVFMFATTEPHKVPATVLSRCQRFDFRPLFPHEIRGRLEQVCRAEGIEWEEPALHLIAQHADGGMRDALAILDQCVSFEGNRLSPSGVEQVIGVAPRAWFHRLGDLILKGDAGEAFRLVQDLRSRGKDLRQFARDAARHLRDLLVLSSSADAEILGTAPDHEREQMLQQAKSLGAARLLQALDLLLRAEGEMRWAANGQLILEAALVRLALLGEAVEEPRAPGEPVSPPQRPSRRASSRVAAPQPVASAGPPEESPAGKEAPSRTSEPVPPPPPGDSPLRDDAPGDGSDIASVQAGWSRVIARLREERRHQTAAFLVEGRPVQIQPDGTLLVEFPPDRRFHRDSFERGKHRQYVEQVLEQVFGRPFQIKTRIAEEEGEGGPSGVSPESRPEATAERETYPPPVEETLRLFGGRVIAIEKVGNDP